MAWHLALMALPTVLSLGTTIFSHIKGNKIKKQAMGQMQQAAAEQKAQIARMMGQMQGQNVGAVNGINSNFMVPSGLGGGPGYGPAPQGYFPPGFG